MAKRDKYTAPRTARTYASADDPPSAQETLKGIEKWYDNRKDIINKILLGAVILVAGFWAYNRFMRQPKFEKANDAVFRAQQYFGMDSVNWALNGDGNNYGFLKIIDKYGSTPAGNLAKYYAGICYLKKGEFDKAIKYLKKFDGKGTMVDAVAKGSIGDAYMELGKMGDAVSAYEDASSDEENVFLSPLYLERLALTYEKMNKPEKAIQTFKKIREKYPTSGQARNVEKYLARLGDFSL